MLGVALAESALEAWAECHPEGTSCPLECIGSRLDAIAARVPLPAGGGSPEALGRRDEFFTSSHRRHEQAPEVSKAHGGESEEWEPMFMQMLEPREGQVHFLYFWRAFGEVASVVAQDRTDASNSAGELDLLRNKVIHLLEASAEDCALASTAAPWPEARPQPPEHPPEEEAEPPQRSVPLSVSALLDAVQEIRSVSTVPAFWRSVADSVRVLQQSTQELGLEELAVVMLSWLHEAAALQPQPTPKALAVMEPQRSASSSSVSSPARRSWRVGEVEEPVGLPVLLHIYDVSQEESVQKLNRILAHRHSPLKFGGVFHAGVEVHGLEWSYGCSTSETIPGVSCGEPRSHPHHHYRQTVALQNTRLSPEDIMDIISMLIEEYPGDDYDLLRRNCCHFADDFSRRLGAGAIPGWVHRLARLGARLDGALQVAQTLHGRAAQVFSVLQPGRDNDD